MAGGCCSTPPPSHPAQVRWLVLSDSRLLREEALWRFPDYALVPALAAIDHVSVREAGTGREGALASGALPKHVEAAWKGRAHFTPAPHLPT